MINIQSFAKAKNTGSSGSSSKSSSSQSSINNTSTSITEDTINIFATSDQDMTEVIQSALDAAYTSGKKIVFGSGEFLVTRAVYIHDGTVIEGQGIYNTIIRTPFMKKPSYFEKDTLAYQKATVALGYVTRDKKKYNTATDAKNCPTLDLKNGHNRFIQVMVLQVIMMEIEIRIKTILYIILMIIVRNGNNGIKKELRYSLRVDGQA